MIGPLNCKTIYIIPLVASITFHSSHIAKEILQIFILNESIFNFWEIETTFSRTARHATRPCTIGLTQ